jgi:non-homologous end joining protein Ku
MSGRFEPEKMPDEYARAVHELVKAKVEHRATEVQIAPEGKLMAPVINIMDALKASMQKQGQAKVRDAVLDALRSHGVEVLEDGLRLVPKKRLR